MEKLKFIVYIGVKNGKQDEAKGCGIKYNVELKKWFIEYDYNEFINNINMKPPNDFKSYSINLLDESIENKKDYINNIYNLLKER
jgi:hypothetical protein